MTEKPTYEELEKIFDLSTDLIGFSGPNGYFTKINSSFKRILGYREQTLLGNPFIQFVHDEDVEKTKEAISDAVAGKKDIYIENRYRCKDGSYKWISWKVVSIKKGHKFIVFGREIAERRPAEKTLPGNKECYRSIIHKIQAAVVVHDAHTRIINCNSKAQELLGLVENQLLGKTAMDPDWAFFNALNEKMSPKEYPVNQVLATRQPLRDLTIGIYRPNKGDRVWVLVYADPVFDDQENVQQVIVTFLDITKHKHADEELSKVTHNLMEAQKIAKLGHWELNLESNTLYWSDEIYRIFGLEPQEFKATYEAFLEAVFPDDREYVRKAYSSSLANGTSYDIEHRILLKNGQQKWVREICNTQYSKEGIPLRSIGTVHDITEHKQGMDALRKSKTSLLIAEEKYRTLFEANSDAVFLVDHEMGNILEANEAACKLYGYSHEELMGLKAMDLSAEPDKTPKAIKPNCRLFAATRYHRKQNGIVFPVEISTSSFILHERIMNISTIRDITERELADEALKKSENKFRSITENATDFIFIKDKDGTYSFVNKAMIRFLGLPKEEIIGKIPEEIFGVEQGRLVREMDNRVFSGETVNETKSLMINDKRLFFNTIQTPLVFENGQVASIMGIVRDVTELKQAEKSLRDSELLFSQMFQQSTTSMGLYAPDGTIVKVNPSFCNMFGVEEEAILNAGYNVFEDQATINAGVVPLLKDIFHKKKTHNWEINFNIDVASESTETPTWKTGKIFLNIFGYPVLNSKGAVAYVVLQHYDITDRKIADKKLRMSEANYRTIFDSGYDAIFVHDMETGAILDVNKQMCELVGYSRDECLNLNIVDMSLGETPFTQKEAAEWIDKAKTQGAQTFEWIVKKMSGETFWVDVTLKRVTIAGVERILATVRDITERKKAEEEKRKALEFAAEQSKLALIGQVAGKMAHDFNNILMGIMGNSQLALMDCDDEIIKVRLGHINEFSERGRDITNTLMSFAKDQEPKQTYFKIEDKIELALKMLEKDLTGIKVSRNYKPGIPELLADPGMIQDSLVNLIQNSIHAMGKAKNPTLNLKAYSQDDKVYFEIEDNGCGIPKEHLDSVYSPSFTLKGAQDVTGSYKSGVKGTGYGLSNVRKSIVEKHKGDIILKSDAGKGTRVTIALKLIKDHLSSDEQKEVAKIPIYDKRRILLVEDEAAIADVQYQILTQKPFYHIVSIATNGQTAIDIYDRNRFDFVSLDYILPGNINGLDVYNHIRENNTDIPIMFISGNMEFLESMKNLKEKDPNLEHLSKPVNNLDYVNKINELIGSKCN